MAPKKVPPKPVKIKKEVIVEYKLRHILSKDEKRINDAYKMFDENYLQKGEEITPDTFGGVAQKISECPSAKKGGAIGWFGKGKLDPEFEKVAFRMCEKSISPVFKASKGFHIVYAEEKRTKK